MLRIAEIQHPSHRHPLTLFTIVQTASFKCDGCKERGLESCYKCDVEGNCNFHLHEDCALASGSGPIFHPFFKNCRFTFHGEYLADNRNCVACGKNVKGFMYESSSNKALVLHPCCLKLPHSKTTSDHGVNVTLREHISHMKKCQICNSRKLSENIKGWAYVSDCGKHRYHVACVKDLIFNNLHNVQVLEPTEGSNTNTLSLRVQQSVFTGKNFRKYSGKLIKLILEIIISAIFGDATSIILTLVDSIQRN